MANCPFTAATCKAVNPALFLASIMAPACSKASSIPTDSGCRPVDASRSAVDESSVVPRSVSTPAAIRASIDSIFPAATAIHSAVHPSSSLCAFLSAPRSHSMEMTDGLPLTAARCNAVSPKFKIELVEALASKSKLMIATSPAMHAEWMGWVLAVARRLIEAPRSIRSLAVSSCDRWHRCEFWSDT